MTFTAAQIRELVFDSLFPPYEKKFGVKRSINFYNISTLCYGANAYLYYMQQNEREAQKIERKYNHHLLRGAAIDRYVKGAMPPEWESDDRAYLRWVLPYAWVNRPELKDIVLVGHYDMRHSVDGCVLEVKAPEVVENFVKKGGMTRAKRQAGTYAKILAMKTGKPHQAFVVVVNHDLLVEEATLFEIAQGFDFVKRAAYQVAKMLDVPPKSLNSTGAQESTQGV